MTMTRSFTKNLLSTVLVLQVNQKINIISEDIVSKKISGKKF